MPRKDFACAQKTKLSTMKKNIEIYITDERNNHLETNNQSRLSNHLAICSTLPHHQTNNKRQVAVFSKQELKMSFYSTDFKHKAIQTKALINKTSLTHEDPHFICSLILVLAKRLFSQLKIVTFKSQRSNLTISISH